MRKHKIEPGKPEILNLEKRKLIYGFLEDIIYEFKGTVIVHAMNVLEDHVHLVAELESELLSNFVRKLKGKCTQLYKKHYEIENEFHLWAQKFNRRILKTEEALVRASYYVKYNHRKHKIESIVRDETDNNQYISQLANGLQPIG